MAIFQEISGWSLLSRVSHLIKTYLIYYKLFCWLYLVGSVISSIQLKSPVTFTYAHHYGPVYSAEFSPFHRNAFLTSSMDQTLRLYSMLQVYCISIPNTCYNAQLTLFSKLCLIQFSSTPNILELTFRFIDYCKWISIFINCYF